MISPERVAEIVREAFHPSRREQKSDRWEVDDEN